MLLHGGGLGAWQYQQAAQLLAEKYRVLVPILNGHAGSDREFTSIEDNARAIINAIDKQLSGQLHLIAGQSLGGQILLDILAQKPDIAPYVLVESANIRPLKTGRRLIKSALALSYPLVKQKWFAHLQFKSYKLDWAYFEDYYRDSSQLSQDNLVAFTTASLNYDIKPEVKNSQARALILVGSREHSSTKKSATILQNLLPNANLSIIPNAYHGQLSINHPESYAQLLLQFLEAESEN